MSGKTMVYMAREPFIIPRPMPGRSTNIRATRLVTDAHPAVAWDPDKWIAVGWATAATGAVIDKMDDGATWAMFASRIIALGDAPALPTPKLPLGRRPLTDDRVRADLDRALATLAADRNITRPTWDQLAGAHEGLGWEGMTIDGLRKRRKQHPVPFAEKVPHLTE